MTEKKLRDDIIVKMLDYKDKTDVDIDDFCSANQIEFSSGVYSGRYPFTNSGDTRSLRR